MLTLSYMVIYGLPSSRNFLWMDKFNVLVYLLVLYWSSVRLGAAATAFLHKLQKGIPPWVPLKGHEEKTYKQLQEEAIESKRRDLAVLKANDGIWPGVRTPSHALFLWASGSEMTTLLESDHMPNKYISKDLRYDFSSSSLLYLVWCLKIIVHRIAEIA